MRSHPLRTIRRIVLALPSLVVLIGVPAPAQASGPSDPATFTDEGPIHISAAARSALHSLWVASVQARQERVACLGGRVSGETVFITEIKPIRATRADSADISAVSSLRECGPPAWFGTVHTHIATFGGRPYVAFSAPDRYVMLLWQRQWKQHGVFCILYTSTEANCEFRDASNTSMAYFGGGNTTF